MKLPERTHLGWRIVLAMLMACLLSPPVRAYLQELSEEDVREAYNLGQRHDQDTVKFFKDYEIGFPNAIPGLHVHHMTIRTPYCAVVVHSFEGGSNYPLRQAIADAAERAGVFEVIVWIDGAANSPMSADEIADFKSRFWGQFAVQASQEHKIAQRKMSAQPEYARNGQISTIIGAQVLIEYDVHDVASAVIHIQATDPGGQSVSADFDLDKLR